MSCGTKDGQPHIYTPLKAIRRKCLDCVCDSAKEVELCPVKDCSLYPYRLGKSPRRQGQGGKGNPQALADWRKKKDLALNENSSEGHSDE